MSPGALGLEDLPSLDSLRERASRDPLLETLAREMRGQLGLRKPPADYVPWEEQARREQLPPDWPWFVWLLLAGRGFGKTRSGAEWTHRRAMEGDKRRWIAIVGRTPGDVRDDMLNSPGGLLTNAPDHEIPEYYPSRRELVWPTGAHATVYSGANPEQLRGYSGDTAWVDELAAHDYPQTTWDNLMFGLREAVIDEPQVVVTTTPKPIPIIKELRKHVDDWVALTKGTSYDNRENLSPRYYKVTISPYEGTRLGRQEIEAEILEDVEGALWTLDLIDQARISTQRVPPLERVAVAIDPAVTSSEDSDETGIMVGGVAKCDCKGRGLEERHGFILDDQSDIYKVSHWARRACLSYEEWAADFVVGEVNNGGDLVERNLRTYDRDVPFRAVRASRGKHRRAEPVASLYEQGKVHHVGGFPKVEEQMTSWVSGVGMRSPDRMDALVWLLTKLMLGSARILGDVEDWGDYRPHT